MAIRTPEVATLSEAQSFIAGAKYEVLGFFFRKWLPSIDILL